MRCAEVALALALGACVAVASSPADAQTASTVRAIDAAHSRATFSVKHIYVAQIAGRVPIVAGSMTFAAGSRVPTAIEATLDPKGISTDDADRDDDLQGPDWLDTRHFATWTFRSQSIVATPEGFTVNGTLTVHGVEQAVGLAVTQDGEHFHATGTVDRHGFGMRRVPMDGLIGRDVALTLDVALRAP